MLMEGKTQLWFKFDPSNRFIKDFIKYGIQKFSF